MPTMWSLLIFVVLVACSTVESFSYGRARNITIYEVKKCPKFEEGPIQVKVHTSNGEKLTDIDINLSKQFDETFNFTTKLNKMKSGEFTNQSFSLQGNACEGFNFNIPGVTEKLYEAIKVKDICTIPAGKYSAKNLQFTNDDVNIGLIIYGMYRIDLNLIDGDGNPFDCITIDADIQG